MMDLAFQVYRGLGNLMNMIPSGNSKGNPPSFGETMGANGSSGYTNYIGIDPEYQALLETQMHMQEQMQQVSLVSNIERSRHESKMAAIRNVRTG